MEDRTPDFIKHYVWENFKITHDLSDLPDALQVDWPNGFSFAHPLPSEAQQWCEKAAKEAALGRFSVLFVPAIFNSCYWRAAVYPYATEIRVLACPIRLPSAKKQLIQQMCLVIFNGTAERDPSYPFPPTWPVEPLGWQEAYFKRERNKSRFG